MALSAASGLNTTNETRVFSIWLVTSGQFNVGVEHRSMARMSLQYTKNKKNEHCKIA